MKKEFGESYYHTRMGSTKITTKVASISMKQYCTITISKPIRILVQTLRFKMLFVCYIDAFKQCVSNIEYSFRYASCWRECTFYMV